MIRRVHLMAYSPSLLGDMNWGGGSFAPSHNPTAVYMTFLVLPQRRDSEILSRLRRHSVYPTLLTKTNKYRSFIHYALAKYQ